MVLSAQLKGVVKLQEGTKVEVHGLEKKPELNGLVGSCLKFDPAKMRWGVEMPDGKQVLLKMNNLRPLGVELTAAPEGVPKLFGGKPAPAAATPDTVAAEAPATEAPAAPAPAASPVPPAEPLAAVTGTTEAPRPASRPAPWEEAAAQEAPRPASRPAPWEEAAAQDALDPTPAEAAAQDALDPTPAEAAAQEALDPTPAEAAAQEAGEGFELPAQPGPPRTGRWWNSEAASDGFADQLRANDPALLTLCLVPPKSFAADDVLEICDGLEKNSVCHELLASGHSLSEDSCRRLADMLRVNRTLRTLSLGDSSLADRASILFEGLGENVSITSLDLEHKALTEASGKKLAEALVARGGAGAPRLETLRLSRNAKCSPALLELAAAPAPRELLLCECTLDERLAGHVGRWAASGIEDLDLRGNSRIGADGVEAMLSVLLPPLARGAAVPAAPPLRRLRLDGCAVGDDGVEALAGALRRGLPLEALFLESCELTAAAGELLAGPFAGARGRDRLAHLSVRMNAIGDGGIIPLAACAERLDVSAADLGPQGFEALAREPITHLEVFNSPRLGMSIGEWCPALSADVWQQLTQLDMSCSALGNDGFRVFVKKLTSCPDVMPKLESLCLGGNDADDAEEADNHSLVDDLTAARQGRIRTIWRNG